MKSRPPHLVGPELERLQTAVDTLTWQRDAAELETAGLSRALEALGVDPAEVDQIKFNARINPQGDSMKIRPLNPHDLVKGIRSDNPELARHHDAVERTINGRLPPTTILPARPTDQIERRDDKPAKP